MNSCVIDIFELIENERLNFADSNEKNEFKM
jgi:hypothetical protein